MPFRVHAQALVDVDDAAAWYNERQPGLGDEFRAAFRKVLAQVRRTPQSASLLETVTLDVEIRRRILKRFPYLVIYQIHEGDVIVLAVVHERRHPNAWIDRILR